MKFNTIVILFLVFSVIIIAFGIWKLSKVDNKQANTDVTPKCYGENCKIECGILNPATVVPCQKNADGTSKCSKCKCDSSGRLSGCMECRDTDPNDTNTLIRNGTIKLKNLCTDPFFWDEKDETCKLKKGSYCLPVRPTDITCNQYTGNKVLTLDDKTNTYKWSCLCKDDTKFSGATCSDINICGLEGSSQNPSNNLLRGLLKAGTTNNYWNTDSDWDPLQPGNSNCSCLRPNEVADNNKLLCLPNSCDPGTINNDDPSGKSCICNQEQGLIDCYTISTSYDSGTPYYNGACKFPSCVPDPCGGRYGENGHYEQIKDIKGNVTGGKCVCNIDDGYHLVQDPNAYGGFSCKQLCVNNGPCGSRGQCKIQDLDKSFTQFTIRCAEMDDNGQCTSSIFHIMYIDNGGNIYYLNYYEDKKELILEKTQNPKSYFNFKLKKCKLLDDNQPDCSNPVTSPVDKGLNSSSSYYAMIGDKYLSFKPNYNDGKYNLLDGTDTNIEDSLFLFLSKEGNKRPLSSVTGSMFFASFSKYLSVNTTDNSITYDKIAKTQEYCDPCSNVWRQNPLDDKMLCDLQCVTKGDTFFTGKKNSSPYTDQEIKKICCSGKGSQYTSDYHSGIWFLKCD